MDYGMFLVFGDTVWAMLYNPRWIQNAGIGFITADVVAFPGSEESESLVQIALPDGRVLTLPYPIGTDPLPKDPPPADMLIMDTTWLRGAEICAIEEGVKVPVYAAPAYYKPAIDWVGLDDRMDYGMFLVFGDTVWAMLYNPRWIQNAGIGFITADVVAFPGSE
jgi:hypothetical protein